MIEWIPIKDYQGVEGRHYLVCYETSDGRKDIASRKFFAGKDRFEFGIYKVTHAAHLNLPGDKTLEEKFAEYIMSDDYRPSETVPILVKIAKEHYEGRE